MSTFCNSLAAIAMIVLMSMPRIGLSESPAPGNKGDLASVADASESADPSLQEYRQIMHQLHNSRVTYEYMQNQLTSQDAEKKSLVQQAQDIEVTKPGLVPLILRMVEHLDKFIQMDLPFLASERQQRIALLKQMLVKADVSQAEKFRRIMEAFQVENEYGKTIEAYKDTVTLKGAPVAVDFLRLGRIALYYLRLDGSEAGYWDKQEKRWKVLDSDYNRAIRNGLHIARKEIAPDMLVVPVSAPEAAQ